MYKEKFSIENINNTYDNIRKSKFSTGVDRINKNNFEKRKKEITTILNKKICNENYNPTPYKETLLIKNSFSYPRKLSIPSIKDKVILEIIREILKEKFRPTIKEMKVTEFITAISNVIKSSKYNSYIKIDITAYYDNINHDLVLKKLKEIIGDEFLLKLIKKYLTNITIVDGEVRKNRDQINDIGVPQGISISNVLGNIYLSEFDREYYNNDEIAYFRYVDDIVLFCRNEKLFYYEKKIKKDLSLFPTPLKINESKYYCGEIKDFNFLGYKFNKNGTIGISEKNIHKIESSIEKIFSEYISSYDKRIKGNIDLLLWKLNFRITGCFKDKRRYGWVIFFCQNEDEKVFHRLDALIKKLIRRFKLENQLIINNKFCGKSFVKTFYEFNSKKDNTKYIPNIDKYTKEEKKDILKFVCKRNHKWVESLSDFIIEKEFNRFIFLSIREVERDLYQIYT